MSYVDPEIEAIGKCVDAVKNLKTEEIARVLNYVSDRAALSMRDVDFFGKCAEITALFSGKMTEAQAETEKLKKAINSLGLWEKVQEVAAKDKK